MPTYKVTDPSSGKTIKLTGDSPPTEDELTEIFGKIQGETPSAIATSTRQPEAPEWAGKYPNVYGAVGATKEVSRFGAESAGLIGGAKVGATAGLPLGPLGVAGGAVLGAGLGYGAVKAGERFIEDEKTTIPRAIKTTAKDVAVGGIMELGGQFVGKMVGGLIERMSMPAVSNIPRPKIHEVIESAKKLGIELSPAEATGSKGQALYESMLDKSPFSAGIITEWRELNQLKPLVRLREKMLSEGTNPQQVEVLGQKIKDQVNSFLGKYKSLKEENVNLLRDNILKKMGSGDTYESIGKTVQEVIATRSKVINQRAQELYGRMGELIPEDAIIPIENLKSTANRILEQEMVKPAAWRDPQLIKRLEGVGGPTTLEQEIAQFPEAMQIQIREQMAAEAAGQYNWKALQSMRSRLGEWIASGDAAMKSTQPGMKFQSSAETGVYKQLRKALDKDMESFAEQTGGDLLNSFKIANAFYREGKLVYDAPAIRRLVSTDPKRVVNMIFRPDSGAEIDVVRKAIGDVAFDNTLKPAFTKRILDTGPTFDPKALFSNIKRYGKELLDKVYTPQERLALYDLVREGKIIMDKKLPGESFLKTVANERPEVVVDSILGQYERNVGSKTILKNTLLIRDAVDKPTFESLQRELSDRIFKLNQITNQVQPERLSKTIQTYDRVLKVFYTPEQVSWLKSVAETGRLMASAERMAANPSGTAQNIVTWGTWGALLANPVKGTFTGIIAPKAMARIYLSDKGRRYFALGLRTPVMTKRGVEIATVLSEIAGTNIQDQMRVNNKEAPNE